MKRLLALTLLAALAVAGCGGSDGSGGQTAAGGASGPTTTTAPAARPAKSDRSQPRQGPASGGGEDAPKPAPEAPAAEPSTKPDRSLQTFGSAADAARTAEAVATMRTYLRALAARDYAAICGMARRGTREEAVAYLRAKGRGGTCAEALALFLAPYAPDARDALAGQVTGVRAKGPDIVVFLRPRGGSPSWLTMTREGGRLRIISLTAGTPLNPVP